MKADEKKVKKQEAKKEAPKAVAGKVHQARYKEVSHVGIYSRTGAYVEFKAGETKEITAEVAEELKNDSRFEVIYPEAKGNEAPGAKGNE